MMVRRASPKFLVFAAFISTILTFYITRKTWNTARLGFDASSLTHWPLTSALQEEYWPYSAGEDTATTEEIVAPVSSEKEPTLADPLESAENFDAVESSPTSTVISVSNESPEVTGDSTSVETLEPTRNLRELCDGRNWTEGLWIQCHSNARRD
jgi:hypothetical protein